jgi:N-acetyl-anhydromuramyl-L-alanine amidase AmpD
MVKGWQTISGNKYYFFNSGNMAKNWTKISNNWYYFGSSGAMSTGWLDEGGSRYYLQSDGKMVTGSLKLDDKVYTFNHSGALVSTTDAPKYVTNVVNVDGKLYNVNMSTGELTSLNLSIDQSLMNDHNTWTNNKDLADDDTEYSEKVSDIQYIVIHYTAGVTSVSGSAANTIGYFNNIDSASATFVVDDANIMQYTDYNSGLRDWHCGDKATQSGYGGSYANIASNFNSIGIEMCSSNTTGKMVSTPNSSTWYFTDAVVNNTIALVKSLLNEFPNATIIRHYDVSGKICPGVPGWNDYNGASDYAWQDFLNKVYSV